MTPLYQLANRSRQAGQRPRTLPGPRRARAPSHQPASVEGAGPRRGRGPSWWVSGFGRFARSAAMLFLAILLLVALILAVVLVQAASASLP
jgi:hypothetical protein